MKLHRISLYVTMLFFVGLFSCQKPIPQLPSNKGNEVDENVASLLQVNVDLATQEDSLLESYVTVKHKGFEKNELGFWFKINNRTTANLLKEKETCRIMYELLLLDGKLVQKKELEITLGKKHVVTGLEEGLKLLHKGESATFIIPWYLGYGRKGLEPIIPPYTSLIYKVKLLE